MTEHSRLVYWQKLRNHEISFQKFTTWLRVFEQEETVSHGRIEFERSRNVHIQCRYVVTTS